MPRISSFFGIVIEMYFEDHGFPHFHAKHADGKARIRIDTLEPLSNTLPRRQLRFVLAWAELHRGELEENWKRARTGETRTSRSLASGCCDSPSPTAWKARSTCASAFGDPSSSG
jgi:hypothetical protein